MIEIPIKGSEHQLKPFVSDEKIRAEITRKMLEEKLRVYNKTIDALVNEYNTLKHYCDKCAEDKIFCSNCVIDGTRVKIAFIITGNYKEF